MKIIVCIKQVPDTTDIRINPDTNTLIREGVESILNPFDLYAIEEAIRLKEAFGGSVVVLSMGPPQVESALRETVAMGADEIILLSDRKFAGADTLATSLVLSEAIKKLDGDKVDIVLFGQQAIDGDTAQVGPETATLLQYPQTCFVSEIVDIGKSDIKVKRLMEDGYDTVSMQLPCVLSVVKEINEPRLPSLRGKRNAKKCKMKIISAEDLDLDEKIVGLNGSPTQVVEIFTPKMDKKVEKFEVDTENAVEILYKKIKSLL